MNSNSFNAFQLTPRRRYVQLYKSGEHERLTTLLRDKLVQCGWRDELKAKCLAVVKQRGRENVTLEDLVRAIGPSGRASVPDSIKADLLTTIKTFIQTLS